MHVGHICAGVYPKGVYTYGGRPLQGGTPAYPRGGYKGKFFVTGSLTTPVDIIVAFYSSCNLSLMIFNQLQMTAAGVCQKGSNAWLGRCLWEVCETSVLMSVRILC